MFGKRQLGWIGIDVGTGAVKIAQVERQQRRFRIARSLVIQNSDHRALDADALSDGWLDSLLQTALLARGGFHGRRAACVLSMSATELRTFDVPPGTDAERRAMIAGELQTDASDAAGSEFDFWNGAETSRGDDRSAASVNVMAVNRRISDGIATSLLRSGLSCEVLDGLPFALARATSMVAPPQDAPLAAVDWGTHGATFTSIVRGRPVFTRALRRCGWLAALQAVGQALDLTPTECQQLLYAYGIPGRNPGDVSQNDLQQMIVDLLRDPLSRFVLELQKTLQYLKAQRSALYPERLWLFGGGATIRNIAPWVAAGVELPVKVWRVSDAATDPAEEAPHALVATAAALSALAWER